MLMINGERGLEDVAEVIIERAECRLQAGDWLVECVYPSGEVEIVRFSGRRAAERSELYLKACELFRLMASQTVHK